VEEGGGEMENKTKTAQETPAKEAEARLAAFYEKRKSTSRRELAERSRGLSPLLAVVGVLIGIWGLHEASRGATLLAQAEGCAAMVAGAAFTVVCWRFGERSISRAQKKAAKRERERDPEFARQEAPLVEELEALRRQEGEAAPPEKPTKRAPRLSFFAKRGARPEGKNNQSAKREEPKEPPQP
jgi:hypothetical protein